MNGNSKQSERSALIASVVITLIGWVYMVVTVGSKLIAPAIV
jgi:hypothetical protein